MREEERVVAVCLPAVVKQGRLVALHGCLACEPAGNQVGQTVRAQEVKRAARGSLVFAAARRMPASPTAAPRCGSCRVLEEQGYHLPLPKLRGAAQGTDSTDKKPHMSGSSIIRLNSASETGLHPLLVQTTRPTGVMLNVWNPFIIL